MAKGRQKYSRKHKIGLPPGSSVRVGRDETSPQLCILTEYGPQSYSTEKYSDVTKILRPQKNPTDVLWIHFQGSLPAGEIEKVGKHFAIHPLTIEDVLNSQHRPKIEVFDHYVHFVVKVLQLSPSDRSLHEKQVNIILGNNYVLSFCEEPFFEPIFHRISSGRGLIRQMKADYLAYNLLDLVIDNYFLLLENYEVIVEEIEKSVLAGTQQYEVDELYEIKRIGLSIKKILSPVKEMVAATRRAKSPLISEEVETYFRDLQDHVADVNEALGTVKESLVSLVDVSFANATERTNSVMKLLAIISAIFLPLNFIVGLFGMNFSVMPLVNLESGFTYVMLMMSAIVVYMIILFRKKSWW